METDELQIKKSPLVVGLALIGLICSLCFVAADEAKRMSHDGTVYKTQTAYQSNQRFPF